MTVPPTFCSWCGEPQDGNHPGCLTTPALTAQAVDAALLLLREEAVSKRALAA